ncbi:hypothetical protein [Epinotia aporema granulovirus]|uniref:Pif-6 n=1 Tax=Epinotia aporema granulovirus TaxID=166056 RepID=K4ERV3_9BBAC|nr:hypothetical protein [Epinotia aporema granulovirus]AER41535.1 hypothetical protein [Epinotia aporema granulovirus]
MIYLFWTTSVVLILFFLRMFSSLSSVNDNGLLDMLKGYNWQIVDNNLIEIIPSERENAWKNILIEILKSTPYTFRTNLRVGTFKHFDYNQPIYYDLRKKSLGITNDMVLRALTPPTRPLFKSIMVPPMSILTVFIGVMLSYALWKGIE